MIGVARLFGENNIFTKDVNNKVELNLDVQSFENVSESTADFVSPEEPVDVAIDTINDIHKEDNTEDVLAPNVLKEDENLVSSENSLENSIVFSKCIAEVS